MTKVITSLGFMVFRPNGADILFDSLLERGISNKIVDEKIKEINNAIDKAKNLDKYELILTWFGIKGIKLYSMNYKSSTNEMVFYDYTKTPFTSNVLGKYSLEQAKQAKNEFNKELLVFKDKNNGFPVEYLILTKLLGSRI